MNKAGQMTIKATRENKALLKKVAFAKHTRARPEPKAVMPTFPDLAVEAAHFLIYELTESLLRTFYTSTINYDPFENWQPLLANFPILRPVLYGLCFAGIFPTFIFTIVSVYLFLADIFVGDLIYSAADSLAQRPLVRSTAWIATKFLPKSLLSR